MAVACLSLSFLAFIVPLGIATVVMGHMSRREIAKSNGRQTGTWLAFAGLIICYLQFALMALSCFVLVAQWHRLNQVAAHDEFTRAAIVEQIMQVKPNAADHRQNAVDSLRLIHARQADYLSAHPNEGYACQLYNLGSDPTTPSELSVHMADSHYEIKINQCRGRDAQHYDDRRYTVVAVPRSDSNPPGSPHTASIRRGSYVSTATATPTM